MRKLYESLIVIVEKKFRVDARYFINGGFWLSFGQMVSLIFGIITTALLANYLDERSYGIYKYLIGLAGLFTTFSLTGVGQSILQTAAKGYRNFYHENLPLILRYNLFISALSLAGSAYYFVNENITLATGCLLIAFFQPLIETFQHIIPQLRGEQKFKLTTTILVIRNAFVSISTVFTLFITQNILWLFFSYLVSQMLVNLITNFIYKKPADGTPIEITQKYLNYAKHTSLRNLIDGLAYKADSIIIFTQLGAINLAIYSIATIIPEQIKGSLKNLASLLMPKYAKVTDPNVLMKSLPNRSVQLFFILVLITILYIVVAPIIFNILFPKYPEAILYSQLAALAFPSFISILPNSILQAKLSDKKLHKINIYSASIQLSLVLVGAASLGVLGVVLANIIRRYILTFIFYYYCYR